MLLHKTTDWLSLWDYNQQVQETITPQYWPLWTTFLATVVQVVGSGAGGLSVDGGVGGSNPLCPCCVLGLDTEPLIAPNGVCQCLAWQQPPHWYVNEWMWSTLGNCNGARTALYKPQNMYSWLGHYTMCECVIFRENTGKYKHNCTITTLTFFLVTKKNMLKK